MSWTTTWLMLSWLLKIGIIHCNLLQRRNIQHFVCGIRSPCTLCFGLNDQTQYLKLWRYWVSLARITSSSSGVAQNKKDLLHPQTFGNATHVFSYHVDPFEDFDQAYQPSTSRSFIFDPHIANILTRVAPNTLDTRGGKFMDARVTIFLPSTRRPCSIIYLSFTLSPQ